MSDTEYMDVDIYSDEMNGESEEDASPKQPLEHPQIAQAYQDAPQPLITDMDAEYEADTSKKQPLNPLQAQMTHIENQATVYLAVVWPGEYSNKMKLELEKSLQTWLSKNKSNTTCSGVTVQEDGNVKMDIEPASAQEDLFIRETKLTLKDQKTASVKRVFPRDVMSMTQTSDGKLRNGPSPLISAASLEQMSGATTAEQETVSWTIPLVHFWYVNQVYREKIKQIERKHGVQIRPDVNVSFNVLPEAGGDPNEALSEFRELVQSCLGDSNCRIYSHQHGQVDWETALKIIQQDQEKLTPTVASQEVTVSNNNTIFKIDQTHWMVMATVFKEKLAEIESKFAVSFDPSLQGTVSVIKATAKPRSLARAATLESHALRALLCLYQRWATSVMSCSLLTPNQADIEQKALEKIVSRHPDIVPEGKGDQWRIIGLPEKLCLAVDEIECNMGRPVFKEEDKQRIGYLTSMTPSIRMKDMKDENQAARATTENDEKDICPICLDSFTNKATLKCKHTFCKECLKKSNESLGPICPICRAVFGKVIGDQPEGRMIWDIDHLHDLPGFPGCGTITIDYLIFKGYQKANHPNPGKLYHSISRKAYLPANTEGKAVLQLLKRAFDQKLIFTVGTSRTTGSDNQVTWNDIHHKTNIFGGPERYGYPDSDYLQRVKEELKAKGIES